MFYASHVMLSNSVWHITLRHVACRGSRVTAIDNNCVTAFLLRNSTTNVTGNVAVAAM